MIRTLTALLALSFCGPVLAALPALAGKDDLAARIDLSLKKGGLRGAKVSLVIADLVSGETLYEKNGDEALVPASLTKVVTSAAALAILKPQYRFRTTLYGTGRQVGSVWKGDLYLRALGDPDLGEERVWSLVNDLRKRGIRTVDGSVFVDDSYFDQQRFGEDWGPLSRAWYNAPHGAVSVNYNTQEVRGRFIAIEGDPARHAGRYLSDMMKREGIELNAGDIVAGAVPPTAIPLAVSDSKPLTEITADLNKVSNNFIAEQILKTLGAETAGPPGTAGKGLAAVGDYLRRIGVEPGNHALFDGSGLSHSNRLTARSLVQVLSATVRDFSIGPEFLASLKVAGVDGKSRRFSDPVCKRRMRVKTGHLYGVAALAGFAETMGGQRLVFAILANDYRRGRYAADRGIEEVCEAFLSLGATPGTALAPDIFAGGKREPAAEPPVIGPEGREGEEEPGEEGD